MNEDSFRDRCVLTSSNTTDGYAPYGPRDLDLNSCVQVAWKKDNRSNSKQGPEKGGGKEICLACHGATA